MFFQSLEGLHANEAKIVVAAKDKSLHNLYKGLTGNVVREAFGWNEEFTIPPADKYPQSPGMASGADS